MPWWGKITRASIISFAFFYVLLCFVMWLIQSSIMYHSDTEIGSPEAYGLAAFEDVRITAADGVHVHVWHKAAKQGYPTVVFFHGNAGNLAMRVQFFEAFASAGFGVVALDYRGFGKSEGTPSEEGFYDDARAALNYAMQTLHLPLSELVLYGESLGTGIAVQMATECDCAALVLLSPYTSMETLAKERYPWLPVHYLLRDTYNSLQKITQVHEPLLLMHGERDIIVPVEQGKTLFAKANNPKKAIYFPDKGHTDLNMNETVKALVAFCTDQKLIAKPVN
jgi:fermentation-respiration switch protein FrsA (DUF1100 family)